MVTVSIYTGLVDDDPQNIVSQLSAWGEYLSEFNLEAFGSNSLPAAAEGKYTFVETTPRKSRTPLGRIANVVKDCREYIKRRDPDLIVQIWKYNIHGPGVTLGASLEGVPVVSRFTGATFDVTTNIESLSDYARLFFGDLMLGNVIGRVPLAITSEMIVLGPTGKSLVTSPPVIPFPSLDESQTTIMPPAPEISSEFTPVEEDRTLEIRRSLGLPKGKTIGLYVGRMTSEKGMGFLENVIQKVDDTMFVLVGDGPYVQKFQNRFGEDVRVEGYIDHDEISKYYQMADFYIHPSAHEGVPLVILEALCCGTPVVARSAGDVSLICNNPVDSEEEMANRIASNDFDTEWLNKDLFEREYQSQQLRSIIYDILD